MSSLDGVAAGLHLRHHQFGSTARDSQREAIGIELDKRYCELAATRRSTSFSARTTSSRREIDNHGEQSDLFAEVNTTVSLGTLIAFFVA